MECFFCKQRYESARELSIHTFLHSGCDEQTYPVVEMRILKNRRNRILDRYLEDGKFDFPIVKRVKPEIPATEAQILTISNCMKCMLFETILIFCFPPEWNAPFAPCNKSNGVVHTGVPAFWRHVTTFPCFFSSNRNLKLIFMFPQGHRW
ncbi:hypothetical protein NPIL_222321 [Nephila pilipes]|uniref:C2H2-type domain-containing protein n=1 Tax=Nephila pilipes TaxID=299642 RepID=A0A8X6P8R5_NEPPI|nr:hypothetical protein NPIL_222321 [Nephila pilipes]